MRTLAAISFADPLMLIGVLAATIPIALHLLNRIRAPVVPFPTLRFLRITAQKTARRRQIQQYLLLLVRVAVFAMVALAVAAPLIRGGSAGLALGLVVMMLAALALLVLAGAAGATAIDRGKGRSGDAARGEAVKRRATGGYWGLSAGTLVAALVLGGFAAFGLFSDRYFSGDRGEFSGRSTACVIVLDNSHSMLVKEGAVTRLAGAKEQAAQLLSQAIRPAEAGVVPTNLGSGPAEPLTTDLTRLLGYLGKLAPLDRARPMQERIRQGLRMLDSSPQPNKMLVIASDFVKPAFSDPELFAGLKEIGWAKDLQLVLLAQRAGGVIGGAVDDVGITALTVAEGSEQPVVGAQVTFEAQIINNGDAANVRDLVFLVDGQPVDSMTPRVQLGAAGTAAARTTLRLPYRLTQTGAHRFGLELRDAPDAMAWDDQRQLVLQVGDPVRALVVGAEDVVRPRSAAFYFMAALSPYEGAPRSAAGRGEAPIPWSIRPAYRGAAQVRDAAALAGNAAVFMCDVPRVTAAQTDALARYVRGGGRLIWVLGPSIDAKNYNDLLVGSPRDLLPAALGDPIVSAAGSPVEWVDDKSDLLANLFDSQEPFRNLIVTGRWILGGAGGAPDAGRALARTADGGVVLVQHWPGGGLAGSRGEVFTLLTTPAAAWSNLGATVLAVPLASRMALGAGRGAEQTSYESGQSLLIRVPGLDTVPDLAALGGMTLDITAPDHTVFNARADLAGQSPRWYFHPLTDGLYTWKSSDGKHSGMFAVAPPGDEADLLPADVAALARQAELSGAARPPIVAANAADLLLQLQQRGEGTSLMGGFLALVLTLAVAEALLANRHRPAAA